MRILIVKTSSMGDLIHAYPVVTDLRAQYPEAEIDWLAEESFADLPGLHSGVRRTVPIAMRRWRRSWLSVETRREVSQALGLLRECEYDVVLDLQGLLKSALWVARAQTSRRVGFGFLDAREPLAAAFYHERYGIPPGLHAMERLRMLAGMAMGYEPSVRPEPGLVGLPKTPSLEGLSLDSPYWVCLHATSRTEKAWPTDRWQALVAELTRTGDQVLLPWGSPAERESAVAIAANHPGVVVPPRAGLGVWASVLAGAQGVVGVDTGLMHLAAAVGAPTVALFAATQAWRFGPDWAPRAVSLGSNGAWPSTMDVLEALARLSPPVVPGGAV